MQIPTKKLKSGFVLPTYGIGTWKMGGDVNRDMTNDEKDVAAITMSIERGVRHIDTAEMYGDGHSEELISQALEQTKVPRDQLTIASKVSPNHMRHDDVMKSCEASLRRLNLDYIDLYMIHFPPPADVDIRETMKALDELVLQGLVKNIGVSNFTPHRYEVAQHLTSNKLVCNQVNYSIMVREVEKYDMTKHAVDSDYLLVAWRPLQLSYEPGVNSYPPIVDKLAKKYDKSPNQIAINWLVSQPNVVTISKTSNPEHLDENLGALGWEMDYEDIRLLNDDYPPEYFCPPRYELDKIESSMTA